MMYSCQTAAAVRGGFFIANVPSNDVALGYPTTTPSRCED